MSGAQKFSFSLLLLIFCCCCSSCNKETSDLTQSSIFPIPQEIIPSGSYFILKNSFNVSIQAEDDTEGLKEMLSASISEITNLKAGQKSSPIKLTISNYSDIPEEGYQLYIKKKEIEIIANDNAGIFYGIQTLLQLIQQEGVKIPTGKITDHPRFSYRGSMLDVSRHFFSVKDVKRYVDHLSRYKMNMLHLHLSDDQGWRIEIPGWERLTTHGGSTEVGGGTGGFYTLDDYKDIVAYANERFITIVPEIDMPGHTNAALASYHELNCDGKARELYTGTEVGFSTLCVDKEITYTFVEDVIRTITEVTPGPYFHIGGDESHVTSDEDYVVFVNRVKDIVRKYGKTMMGWDEISHADIDPGTIVQWWARPENALRGIEKDAKVLVSPASRTYLDMQYDSTTYLGLHWAGYVEVDSAYLWDPADMVQGINNENIIGIEAPLWTETVTNMEELEYMVFPRVIGHAELGWSDASDISWESYKSRLISHQKILDHYDINFYKSPMIPWQEGIPKPGVKR